MGSRKTLVHLAWFSLAFALGFWKYGFQGAVVFGLVIGTIYSAIEAIPTLWFSLRGTVRPRIFMVIVWLLLQSISVWFLGVKLIAIELAVSMVISLLVIYSAAKNQ